LHLACLVSPERADLARVEAVGDVFDRLRKVMADGARGSLGGPGCACGEDLAVLAVEASKAMADGGAIVCTASASTGPAHPRTWPRSSPSR
jgi:hypothetical protein